MTFLVFFGKIPLPINYQTEEVKIVVDVTSIHPVMYNLAVVLYLVALVVGFPLMIATFLGKVRFSVTFVTMLALSIVIILSFFIIGALNGVPISEIMKALMWFSFVNRGR